MCKIINIDFHWIKIILIYKKEKLLYLSGGSITLIINPFICNSQIPVTRAELVLDLKTLVQKILLPEAFLSLPVAPTKTRVF